MTYPLILLFDSPLLFSPFQLTINSILVDLFPFFFMIDSPYDMHGTRTKRVAIPTSSTLSAECQPPTNNKHVIDFSRKLYCTASSYVIFKSRGNSEYTHDETFYRRTPKQGKRQKEEVIKEK